MPVKDIANRTNAGNMGTGGTVLNGHVILLCIFVIIASNGGIDAIALQYGHA